jgi:hypothetical protein
MTARSAIAGLLAITAAVGSCSGSSGAKSGPSSPGPASCASDSDCSGGAVCGWSNQGDAGGGDAGCSARGICVTPVNRQTTMLCGCGGKAIDLVVDDPDAGIYYWSGVVVGEQGFPPCGDAAIAPSSNPSDASSQ